MVEEVARDTVLVAHHVLPVRRADWCSLNEISTDNNGIRTRDDRRFADIAITVPEERGDQRVIVDRLVAGAMQI